MTPANDHFTHTQQPVSRRANRYLKRRDAKMHAKAKAIVKDCYEKYRLGDPQYSSLAASMKARLGAVVDESHWKKAHDSLENFLSKKELEQQRGGSLLPGAGKEPAGAAAAGEHNSLGLPVTSFDATGSSSKQHLPTRDSLPR